MHFTYLQGGDWVEVLHLLPAPAILLGISVGAFLSSVQEEPVQRVKELGLRCSKLGDGGVFSAPDNKSFWLVSASASNIRDTQCYSNIRDTQCDSNMSSTAAIEH